MSTEYPFTMPSSSSFLTRWATVTTETSVFLARSLNDWRPSISSSLSSDLSRLSGFICEQQYPDSAHLIKILGNFMDACKLGSAKLITADSRSRSFAFRQVGKRLCP